MIENFEYLVNLPIFPLIGFVVGSFFGSFLNVCAHRIPHAKSVVFPGSHCPSCGTPIMWYRNLPIFSWILQKGRAACCSYIIPTRYLLVEVVTGAFFAYFSYQYTNDGDMVSFIASCIFSWIMLAIIVIDYETMMIPDRLSIGGAFVGLVFAFIFPDFRQALVQNSWLEHFSSGLDAFIGLLIGSSLLYWIGALGYTIFGRDALGEGDVKLLGCIGAFCGWQGAVFTIFVGALIGTLFLLPVMLFQQVFKNRKKCSDLDNNLVWGTEVPFGPYLAIAGLFYFLGASSYIDPWFDPIFWLFYNT